jgi:uncharacterized protein (TIGR03437 family)
MVRSRYAIGLSLICAAVLADSTAARADAPGGSASAPSYSAGSIVHAATQSVQALAPNTIATLYGTNLAFDTVTVTPHDVSFGTLPTTIAGVTVYVAGLPAHLFYLSPGQINFLIPYELTAGTVNIVVARQGLSGPTVPIQLNSTAPGLFPWKGYAIAAHLDGSVVGDSSQVPGASPAKPGEIVILFVLGLGRTAPDTSSGRVTPFAASIRALSNMQIMLAGSACPAAGVLYAGLAPGFAGLYQINLKLPDTVPDDPEIRISIADQIGGNQMSPALLRLAVRNSDWSGLAQPSGFSAR